MWLLICCILLIYIIKMKIELNHINQQTALKIKEHSRFTITSDIHTKEYDQLCEHLNHLYELFQNAQYDQINKEKAFQEMLASIAHDVRTPLTSIQGYLNMLEDEDEFDVHHEYYQIIHQRIYDIRHILEQFFLYSKVIDEDYSIDVSACPIYDICCESLAGFYQQFILQGIEPKIRFKQQDFTIYANKDLLRRVFDNLISNALIHGQGDICIVQNHYQVIFSNRIDPLKSIQVDHIFERFYKGDHSRSTTSSGLGLTIVQKIIEQANGKINAIVENETFMIMIDFKKTAS